MPHASRTAAVRIRSLRPGEWRTYRRVRLRSLATDPLAFGSTLARERDLAETQWRDRLTHGPGGSASRTWAAIDARERFVGVASVVDVDGDWHVFAMWVAPALRGRRVGARLLDAGIAWARSVAPRRRVVLDVNPRQVAAHRLYESRGFRATGRTEPLGHTDGESVVEMVLGPRSPVRSTSVSKAPAPPRRGPSDRRAR